MKTLEETLWAMSVEQREALRGGRATIDGAWYPVVGTLQRAAVVGGRIGLRLGLGMYVPHLDLGSVSHLFNNKGRRVWPPYEEEDV